MVDSKFEGTSHRRRIVKIREPLYTNRVHASEAHAADDPLHVRDVASECDIELTGEMLRKGLYASSAVLPSSKIWNAPINTAALVRRCGWFRQQW